MREVRRRTVGAHRLALVLATSLAPLACNAILGIDEQPLRPSAGDDGVADDGGLSDADGGGPCEAGADCVAPDR